MEYLILLFKKNKLCNHWWGPPTMEWLTFSTHSYSPYLESKVPFCSERSLSVKRGPSSWMPTFFSFLKMYLNRRLCDVSSELKLIHVSRGIHCPSGSPVEPEENEVPLVVEGGHLPAQELRVLGEEGGKQSSDAVTQACGEVVQDHLGVMFRWILASPLQRQNTQSPNSTRFISYLVHFGWGKKKKDKTNTRSWIFSEKVPIVCSNKVLWLQKIKKKKVL